MLGPRYVVLRSELYFGQLYRFGLESTHPPHGVRVIMDPDAFPIVSDYRSEYATDLRTAKGLADSPIRRVSLEAGISPQHKGIDIYAPVGTPVLAMADGRVEQISEREVSGRTLTVAHDSGLSTHYVHLHGWLVAQGSAVVRGQIIATVGASGTGSGATPHLHLELREYGQIVNPHYYWYNGRGSVTLFRPTGDYRASPHLLTYPLPSIRDVRGQTDWSNFGLGPIQ